MSDFVAAATALLPRLLEGAADVERDRRVPKELAQDLAEAGFYRMLVPRSLGGGEVRPVELIDALEVLGRGCGATAWTVMTGATTGLLSAYLPEVGAEPLFGDPQGIYAGVFAPLGRAKPVEGGYRLTGQWPFMSGVDNATVRLGGGLVIGEDGKPRRLASGEPELRSFFFGAADSQIIDTWHTAGLCGTGSHDVAVSDVFVPAEHTACVFVDRPAHDGVLYAFPLFGVLALGVASVGLGIARAAVDEATRLARNKRSGRRTLAESELVQVRLAGAEGELRAALALLRATADQAWTDTATTKQITDATRASVRLASTHAARAAKRVVDTAYHLGGGTALYSKSPLQRCLRDVNTMTQHIMVAEPTLRPVGRILLGLETNTSQL